MDSSPQVLVYHLPGCQRCREIVRWLEAEQIPFRMVNVLTNPKTPLEIPDGVNTPYPGVRIGERTLLNPTPAQLRIALRRARPVNGKALGQAGKTAVTPGNGGPPWSPGTSPKWPSPTAPGLQAPPPAA